MLNDYLFSSSAPVALGNVPHITACSPDQVSKLLLAVDPVHCDAQIVSDLSDSLLEVRIRSVIPLMKWHEMGSVHAVPHSMMLEIMKLMAKMEEATELVIVRGKHDWQVFVSQDGDDV